MDIIRRTSLKKTTKLFSRDIKDSKLSKYYSHKGIRSFGLDLIQILFPVYLLLLGLNVVTALLWFFSRRLFQIIMGLSVVHLSNRLGIKKSMLLGVFLEGCFLLIIPLLTSDVWTLLPAAFLIGLAHVMYWMNELTLFTEISKKKDEGLERGITSSLENAVSLLSPVIGALILVSYGIFHLSFLAAFIVLLSSIPIFLIKDIKFKIDLNIKNIRKYSNKYKLKKKTILQIVGRGMQEETISILWPMLIFISGMEILEIGLIGALIAFTGMLAPMIFGRMADLDHKKLMKFSMIGMIALWGVVFFTKEHTVLYILSFFIGLFSESLWQALSENITELGKKYDASFFGVLLELVDDFSRGLVLLILIPIIFFFGLNAAFVIMVIISFLFVLVME